MILSLLALLMPSKIPTAIPTVTAIIIPSPSPIPALVSMAEKSEFGASEILTIVSILVTLFLGYSAIKSSGIANSIAKQQAKREVEMRERENKIAILDKAFEVYRFFTSCLSKHIYDNKQLFPEESEQLDFSSKKLEIRYYSRMIFNDDVYKQILLLLEMASFCYAPKLIGSKEVLLALAKKYDFEDNLGGLSLETDSERTSILSGIVYDRINKIFENYRLRQ